VAEDFALRESTSSGGATDDGRPNGEKRANEQHEIPFKA
jgi:hypothetical protein